MLLSPILTLDSSKVEDDLVFLMGCLREVLEESGEHSLAGQLPWLATAAASAETISPERLSQAYSIAFRLLSMVEQNAAVQQQRQTEADGNDGGERFPDLHGAVITPILISFGPGSAGYGL